VLLAIGRTGGEGVLVLFTDYGYAGPYVGQMKAVLAVDAPGVPIIDLMHDAPAFAPRLSAYLLAALAEEVPVDSVFVAVVDPGVGGAERLPVVVRADQRWFVGPENGLFEIVRRRAEHLEQWQIAWAPQRLSRTFHGRDLFAPVAARLATNGDHKGMLRRMAVPPRREWPDDDARVVYVDGFGNLITGFRATRMPDGGAVMIGEKTIPRRDTFSDAPVGSPFWYVNSIGLVEIAANSTSASALLGLRGGDPVTIVGCERGDHDH
jgi:S-adenosylmethionine hydrolase